MTEPRTPSSSKFPLGLALAAALAALPAGCGGEPPINDTAETIRPETAKPTPAPPPTPTPAPSPEAVPAKEAPKG